MGDMAEGLREKREANARQRRFQRESFPDKLKREGFSYVSFNYGAHFKIKTEKGMLDFWPGTSKWKSAEGEYFVGWKKFIAYLETEKCPRPANPDTEYKVYSDPCLMTEGETPPHNILKEGELPW